MQAAAPKILEGERKWTVEDASQVSNQPQLLLYAYRGAHADDESHSDSESYDSDSCSDLEMYGEQ